MEQEQKQKQISSFGSILPPLSPKYQWLVSQELETDDNISSDQVFFTLQDPHSHYRCRIPQLLGKRIRACFHGWVILSDHPRNVMWSLWNPHTSKLIRLPPLTHEDEYFTECCLTSPPDDDPSSVLLFAGRKEPTFVFCRLDRKRKKLRWTEMSYSKQLTSIIGKDGLLCSLTCCNGKVYALDSDLDPHVYRDCSVIQIDIMVNKDRHIKITLLPLVKCPSGSGPAQCNKIPILIEFRSKLLIMYAYMLFKFCLGSMYLSKLDFTNLSWEEMQDLKDTIVFVDSDRNSVFNSHAIASSEFGGYIHVLSHESKVIYSYNVKDKVLTLSSTPRLDLSTRSCRSRRNYVSAWAMPECRLQVDYGELNQQEEDKGGELMVIGADAYKSMRNQQHSTESHMLNIPFHVLEMIMDFFADVDYINFRATCKYLVQSRERTAIRRLYSPWLMFLDKNRGIITFTDPMFGDKCFIRTPQKLIGDFRIHYSRNGWLLMSKDTGEVMFFNPFTNDIRELPHPQVPCLETLFFSSPPTSPDCNVVGLITKGEWHVYIHSVGQEQSWRRVQVDFGGARLHSYRFPIFLGQLFLALQDDGGLDAFIEKGDGMYDWGALVKEAPGRRLWKTSAEYFLVKRDETILLVVVGSYGESVELFMLKFPPFEWEKMDNLGGCMICICASTCLCMEAKTPEMENKIFFSRFHYENEKIVFYSLETCRYHTFNGKYIKGRSLDLSGTKEYVNLHTWIEPSCC